MKVSKAQRHVLERKRDGAQFTVTGGTDWGRAQLALSDGAIETVYLTTARALIRKNLITPIWPNMVLRTQGYQLTALGRKTVK